MIEPDHLVIAAKTLIEGARYVLDRLGVEPSGGGKHARMGTHNRLLRLGSGAYLEVIAIDPDGSAPFQPRWFGLDDPEMQKLLELGPKLIHWVARTDDIERDAAGSLERLGAIHPMERGNYKWRITIPEDGHLPADGIVPTLIQWDVQTRPSATLPDSGLRLLSLEAVHPEPGRIREALVTLGLEGLLELRAGNEPRLEASIQTPTGTVILGRD